MRVIKNITDGVFTKMSFLVEFSDYDLAELDLTVDEKIIIQAANKEKASPILIGEAILILITKIENKRIKNEQR